MADESISEGFTKLPDTVRRAVGRRIKDPFDLGVYAHLKMEAAWSTGIYHGNALDIAYRFGNLKLYPKIKRSIFRLRKSCLINYRVTAGKRGDYDVLIDGFQVTFGGLKGKYLNAWSHSSLAKPEYEDAACERPEDGLKTACERPEDGPTQDDQDVLDVLDVSRCGQTEQSSARHDSSPAPLRGDDNIPHRGPQNKNNDNIKDSGRPPNPQVSPVQSIPIDALIIDTPWEQENEDALIAWKTSYARPFVLDDFLLIEAKFGERIQAVLDGYGTLPLIIKWACYISKDFRDLNDTGEFREEFPHILLKITGYILAGELTPRMFLERVEIVYRANLTFGNGVPDPMDILEEEYINWCDENETEMDMLNPWAEDDASELIPEGTVFNPWED